MSNDERNIPGIKVPPPLIYLLPLVSDKPVSRLATEGTFRYTRNPACLGLAIIYAGIAVLRNALWTILPLPPVLIVIQREVIGHEERYLERSLGEIPGLQGDGRRWVQRADLARASENTRPLESSANRRNYTPLIVF